MLAVSNRATHALFLRSHLPMHPHPHGIIVYHNRLRLLGLAALSALFVVGILSLRGSPHAQADPRTPIVTFCGLPFFALGTLVILARALWPGPSLVINEEGVFDRISGGCRAAGLIPCSNIAALDTMTVKHRFWKERRLYIILDDLTPESKAFLARTRWRGAIAGKMLRITGGPRLLIMQSFLSMPIPDLLNEIERLYPAQL